MSPTGELRHDGDPRRRPAQCSRCGAAYEQSVGFITLDGEAHAIYYASCHHHAGIHDAWIDVILGSWSGDDDGPEPADHATFSCRVGPGSAAPEPYASLVQAPVSAAGESRDLFGKMLSREEALQDPRLDEFWRVVDFVVEHDRLVSNHLRG
jgi:hypothetical protein